MLLFDIKRYAIHDGPGIRVTIFMKGCPLSCVWCHNPEGISFKRERLYTKKRCIGCATCVNSCPVGALALTKDGVVTDRSLCRVCGKCTEVCPTLAMEMSGREYTLDEVMREIEKEGLFMDRSRGGVTFCGGEPLAHPRELIELLDRCGERSIHRVVDTTLFAAETVVREVIPRVELLLVDLKVMDSVSHKRFTGVPNEPILRNIRQVAEAGVDFVIRIPLIEGVNADETNIDRSAAFLASLPWSRREVNLLPYHDIGKAKHEKRGTVYNPEAFALAIPSESVISRCVERFGEYGIKAIVGG